MDGVRIGVSKVITDDSEVQAVTWSPQHAAMDIMVSKSFSGASAAVIVLDEANPDLEAKYRNEVRAHLGSGIPTRTIVITDAIDSDCKSEILRTFRGLYDELLESRE